MSRTLSLAYRHANYPSAPFKQRLSDSMYQTQDRDKRFVTGGVIDQCWPRNQKEIETMLGLVGWSATYLNILQDDMKRVTCILAWIEIEDFCEVVLMLVERIASARDAPPQNTRRPPLFDRLLPLSQARTRDFFGGSLAELFYEAQFLFKSIAICSYIKGIQEESTKRRWPFTEGPEDIGSGGYSSVVRVKIAKGQLRRHKTDSNNDDTYLAVKRLREGGAWMKEVKRLDLLRESLEENKRLVLHIAAIIRGPEFFIFMEYTELGDLEAFLREGCVDDEDGNETQKYSFSDKFPNVTLISMLQEFAALIKGIDFLHNRVSSERGIPVYCAHIDLRPQNILVFPRSSGENNPVGTWKISDFGIASFKHQTSEALPEPAWKKYPSIGDIGQRRWQPSGSAHTSPLDLSGPYRGPEMFLTSHHYDPRASDIWALGCILCELLVFGSRAAYRKDYLQQFREQRPSFREDTGSVVDSFYDWTLTMLGEVGYITFSVREKVQEWIRNLKIPVGQCNSLAIDVLRCIINPNPEMRCKADILHKQISNIASMAQNGDTQTLNGVSFDAKWNVEVQVQEDRHGVRRFKYVGEVEGVPTGSLSRRGTMRVHPPSLRIAREVSLPKISESFDVVKISPTCNIAVYLSRKSKKYKLLFRGLDPLYDTADAQRLAQSGVMRLPEKVEWNQMALGKSCLIVRGSYKSNKQAGITALHMINLDTETFLDSPLSLESTNCLTQVITTCGDIIAFASSRTIWIWAPGGQPRELPSPGQTHSLVHIAMSHDAMFLFVWWGSGMGDILQIWDIYNMGNIKVRGSSPIAQGRQRRQGSFILPCGKLPACIIRDSQGSVSTFMASDDLVQASGVMRENMISPFALPDVGNLCIATDHLLAFIHRNSILFVHRLIVQNEILDIEKQSLIRFECCKMAQSIGLHERDEGATEYALRICNARGEVVVLDLGPAQVSS